MHITLFHNPGEDLSVQLIVMLLLCLQIFEKGRTERLLYCGTSSTVRGRVKLEGETLYNILYVQFYSNYRITDRGFNITFRHLKGMKITIEFRAEREGLHFVKIKFLFRVKALYM